MAHCTSSFGLPEYTTFGVVYSGVSDQYGVKDAACPISTKGGGVGVNTRHRRWCTTFGDNKRLPVPTELACFTVTTAPCRVVRGCRVVRTSTASHSSVLCHVATTHGASSS
jgi:hypothetical protein